MEWIWPNIKENTRIGTYKVRIAHESQNFFFKMSIAISNSEFMLPRFEGNYHVYGCRVAFLSYESQNFQVCVTL